MECTAKEGRGNRQQSCQIEGNFPFHSYFKASGKKEFQMVNFEDKNISFSRDFFFKKCSKNVKKGKMERKREISPSFEGKTRNRVWQLVGKAGKAETGWSGRYYRVCNSGVMVNITCLEST